MAIIRGELKEEYAPKFAAMVLRTLEEVAETSPIPKLAKAAKLALQITTTVDSTIEISEVEDRYDFYVLAVETRAFVYLIFIAHQNVQKEDDSQLASVYDFDRALAILGGVNELATKCCMTKRIAPLRAMFDYYYIQHCRVALLKYLHEHRSRQATGIEYNTLIYKLINPHWGMAPEMIENKDLESICPAPLGPTNLYGQMSTDNDNYETSSDENILMLNDTNRADRVMNDYYGVDFAWTSGIHFGSNNNMKMVQRSS